MPGPRLLFVSLTNDYGTERLVAECGRVGAHCAVLGPPGSFASLVRCVSSQFDLPGRLPGLSVAFVLKRALKRAVRTWSPDRVIPLDDLSATLLRSLASRLDPRSRLGMLLHASFGDPSHYRAACERVALMRLAEGIGVRVPAFASHTGGQSAIEALPLPLMVKRDQSSGSGGVVRVNETRVLAAALRQARWKGFAKRCIARLAGFGQAASPVLLQRAVEGRLAMFTAVVEHGRLVDGVGLEAIACHPAKGSSTILRHCQNAEMRNAATRIAAALRCSGFVSFDFILDEADRAYLIEMNARPIGSVHLGRRFGHDLAQTFVTGTPGRPTTAAQRHPDIALFPKELERDPTGQRLDSPHVVHDVPATEPAVVAAYLRRLQSEHPDHVEQLTMRCLGPIVPQVGAPAPSTPRRRQHRRAGIRLA